MADKDMNIMDSGERKKFDSGAVRDVSIGKGRCDLLPLKEVSDFLGGDEVLGIIGEFEKSGDETYLIKAAFVFATKEFPDPYTAVIEYSKHMENGALKYDDRNWEKGIPLDRYVDSGIRHYLKHLRGDDDERHDRAFVWNMLCGAWTARNKPELNCFKCN